MSVPRSWKTAGSVSNLQYHFVWCPKYRLPVLVDAVAKRLRDVLLERAAALELEVEALEIMPDHMHLCVRAEPMHAPQQRANQVQGYSSRVLRAAFPQMRKRMPTLWSRSSSVGSAGHGSTETIRAYIATQKGRS